MMKKKVVYCSGPLFSPEDLEAMSQIATALEGSGYQTFLPQRDGLEALVMNSVDSHLVNSFFMRPLKTMVSRAVFSFDIHQIVGRCNSFVFNMNGRVCDEGGVVETAAAFASGKPIVLYRNDLCSPRPGSGGLLLIGASHAFSLVNEVGEIPVALRRLEQKADTHGESVRSTVCLPARVRRTLQIGRIVGNIVSAFRLLRPTNKLLKNEGRG